jgi:hypothetical protein
MFPARGGKFYILVRHVPRPWSTTQQSHQHADWTSTILWNILGYNNDFILQRDLSEVVCVSRYPVMYIHAIFRTLIHECCR